MKKIFYIVLLVLGSVSIWGQTQMQFLDAARDAYDQKDYYSSLAYYLEALKFDDAQVGYAFEAAESARMFHSYKKAEELYRQVVDNENDGNFPMATFRLAEVLQLQGKYDEAITNYRLYLSEQEGEDEYFTARAQKEINNCEWAKEVSSTPLENVEINKLGDAVNTEHSEFGAVIEPDGISYSSMAFKPSAKALRPQKPISHVLKYTGTVAVDYQDGFNSEELLTAHTAYNTNRTTVYYTLCEYVNSTDIRCDLYSRSLADNGLPGDAYRLDGLNMEGYTTTQPNVGFDQNRGIEVLYFVSDRPGGKGKLDIWTADILGNGKYGEAKNLSDINTNEDDITPFYHNNSQVLYFSSQGYTTMGGFDIYRSAWNQTSYDQVENLGAPVNSSFNDVYYSLSSDGSRALYSSNRIGAYYIDPLNESCCYDIYEADIEDLEINMNVLSFDAKTLENLDGVMVKLIDARTGAVISEIENIAGNDHLFELEQGKDYLFVASKSGYDSDTLRFSTHRIYRSEDLVRKVFLNRNTFDLQVLTFDDVTKATLSGTTVRLIDLTDNSVQEVTLTNDAGHDFNFTVVPNHNYRLVASRDRYEDATLEFVAEDIEGNGLIVKRLYLDRKDLNRFLPLSLYFNNDRPVRRSLSLTTDLTYSETYQDYEQLESEFKAQYTRGMSSSDQVLGEQRIADFFANDLRSGYLRFNSFMTGLLQQLQAGKSFEISLRGFASPRSNNRYNLALSQRRVISVENEMKAFSGGALNQYIDNGQLTITQLSYGENLSPTEVSDRFSDRRNSWYSPEASRERRVEIVEVKSQLLNN